MKTIYKFTLVLITLTLLSACSSTRITYDKQTDFSQYHSFAFYKKGLKHLKMPAQKKRFVLRSISEELQNKGFKKSGNPDLIINIFTDIHNRIDVYERPYYPGYHRGYTEKSKEGTIFIDIVDRKTKQIIWSGSRYINFRDNDYKVLRKAIYKLMKKFPPKA